MEITTFFGITKKNRVAVFTEYAYIRQESLQTKNAVLYIRRKKRKMKLAKPLIDLDEIDTVVYHIPGGPTIQLGINEAQEFLDFDLEMGDYCDTSAIDGTLHFFPKGNA